jgi:DNA-binding NarL/FixJ family response regulator
VLTEVRIVMADDHPIVRQGLRQAIEAVRELKIIAEASDGRKALEYIRTLKPDIAILDIDMPEADGFDVGRAVSDEKLGVEIIFLTIHREEEFLTEAIGLGAKGYVLKDSALSDIVDCIKTVSSGRSYVSPALTGHLLNRQHRSAKLKRDKPGLKDLSPTELRVLRLITECKTSKEIAEELFISYRTVETHRTNICNKLGISGSHALIKFVLAHKSELG